MRCGLPSWAARLLVLAAPLSASAAEASQTETKQARYVQPVQEYFVPLREDAGPRDRGFTENYTHLGSEYGPIGSGTVWEPGRVRVDLGPGERAGMWQSLAGTARETGQVLNFRRCYPGFIRDPYQLRCVGVALRASGTGTVQIEIRSADGRSLWSRDLAIDSGADARTYSYAIEPEEIGRAKFLNWTAQPGARLSVDAISLVLEGRALPIEDRVFLFSFAKLARCYSEADGIVKDKAHYPAGEFDVVPASGLFCLATAAARDRGVVDRRFAEETLRKVHGAVNALPRAYGLLPHFLKKEGGRYRIFPGMEYSTIDTSLYYHGMLLAAEMLGDRETLDALTDEVKSIAFDRLLDPDGFVIHGVKDDGRTKLTSSWRDWGGETALVLLLQRMAMGDRARPRMEGSGKVYQGVGFIVEVQSLFHPQFDSEAPDRVTHVNWRRARSDLLERQKEAVRKARPDSEAARLGVFGLSAGEGPRGVGYTANGADNAKVTVIHPHYLLLSARTRAHPRETYDTLLAMEARGLLPPWGMVENVTPDLDEYLPYLGSLNGSFESLAAYHLWATTTGGEDRIYAAAHACPLVNESTRIFYEEE